MHVDIYHPTLFAYMLFRCYGLCFLFGWLRGAFHSVSVVDFDRVCFTDPTLFFVIARSLVLILGVVGVWLCYRLTRQLYDHEAVALLATAWFGSSLLLVSAATTPSRTFP